MDLARVRQHVLDARLDRLVEQVADRDVRIETQEHALAREKIVRRVGELAERQI